jgi:hypothetical protein
LFIFLDFLAVKQIQTKADLLRLKIAGKLGFVGYWLIFTAAILETQVELIVLNLRFFRQ